VVPNFVNGSGNISVLLQSVLPILHINPGRRKSTASKPCNRQLWRRHRNVVSCSIPALGRARPDFRDGSIHTERVAQSSRTQSWNLHGHNHRDGNGSFKFTASDYSYSHSKSCIRRSEFSCVQPQFTSRCWYSYRNRQFEWRCSHPRSKRCAIEQ
jgi:hypothetical protein